MASSATSVSQQLIQLGNGPKSTESWSQIQTSAHDLANALRVKSSDDLHTVIGATDLPNALVVSIRESLSKDSNTPTSETAPALYELLRVTANLLMDHDINRGKLLEQNIVAALKSVIDGYSTQPSLLNELAHLKVAKTSVGVLLNLSLGYEPARTALVSAGVPQSVLRLATTVYTPGQWASSSASSIQGETLQSTYQWKGGIADWTWRLVDISLEDESGPIFDKEALDALISPLEAFIPPYSDSSALVDDEDSRQTLVNADIETLEECVTQLEALSLDSEPVRSEIAKSSSRLDRLLQFIEKADYPPYWTKDSDEETKRRYKSFDVCKAAVIKVLVSVAGDNQVLDILWDKNASPPGGPLISKLVEWITDGTKAEDSQRRDDLVICASLSIGNIVRNDAIATALAREPYNLIPQLVSLLRPEVDIKLKHAAAGLLKNLSLATPNLPLLREANILSQLSKSELWSDKYDMAEVVQASAVGIAKLVCNNDYKSCLELAAPPEPSGLDQIISLVSRSDSVVIQSEGARLLSYATKALWRRSESRSEDEVEALRSAMVKIVSKHAIEALVQLLARGVRHVILLNESLIALTLISGQAIGAPLVREALLEEQEPLPSKVPTSPNGTTTGLESVIAILTNPEKKYPPELQANCCSFLAALRTEGKAQAKSPTSPELDQITAAVKEPLERLLNTEGLPELVKKTAILAKGSVA